MLAPMVDILCPNTQLTFCFKVGVCRNWIWRHRTARSHPMIQSKASHRKMYQTSVRRARHEKEGCCHAVRCWEAEGTGQRVVTQWFNPKPTIARCIKHQSGKPEMKKKDIAVMPSVAEKSPIGAKICCWLPKKSVVAASAWLKGELFRLHPNYLGESFACELTSVQVFGIAG